MTKKTTIILCTLALLPLGAAPAVASAPTSVMPHTAPVSIGAVMPHI